MPTQAETQMLNEALLEHLTEPGLEKNAESALTDYVRTKVREDGVYRRLIPPIQVSNSDLTIQVDTDRPVIVLEKEPDSPAAVTLPFASLPTNTTIKGPRYRVSFARIVSRRFVADVDTLRTYRMDIRQILSDNTVKDMLAEEDATWFSANNAAMLGPDVPVPHNGNVAQWRTLFGGISRETLAEMRKIMPEGPSHLEVHTCVMNNVTAKEFEKFPRDEMGGDFSQDIIKNGWAEEQFLGMRWIISIKRDLIPDDSVFMYADPKFIGKSCILEDSTMYVRREAYMIEFFLYETVGGAIAHTGGLARADFA